MTEARGSPNPSTRARSDGPRGEPPNNMQPGIQKSKWGPINNHIVSSYFIHHSSWAWTKFEWAEILDSLLFFSLSLHSTRPLLTLTSWTFLSVFLLFLHGRAEAAIMMCLPGSSLSLSAFMLWFCKNTEQTAPKDGHEMTITSLYLKTHECT